MDEMIAAMAIAMCQSALGGKRCPCAETGKFNCRNEYPGEQATVAYNAMRETLVPVMYAVEEEGHPIISYITREKPTEQATSVTPLYALPEIDNG
jgi:hypothetical protein